MAKPFKDLRAKMPAAAQKRAAARVRAMRDADIDLSDIPEVTAEMAARGVVRIAGKVMPRARTGKKGK